MTQLEFNYHVKEYYAPLRGYALKLTRAVEDAEDLVQETMLKAFKKSAGLTAISGTKIFTKKHNDRRHNDEHS